MVLSHETIDLHDLLGEVVWEGFEDKNVLPWSFGSCQVVYVYLFLPEIQFTAILS